jgi:hypothetical protein
MTWRKAVIGNENRAGGVMKAGEWRRQAAGKRLNGGKRNVGEMAAENKPNEIM